VGALTVSPIDDRVVIVQHKSRRTNHQTIDDSLIEIGLDTLAAEGLG
jgi:hypothetical protein